MQGIWCSMVHVIQPHILIRRVVALLVLGLGGLVACADSSPGCKMVSEEGGVSILRCPGGGTYRWDPLPDEEAFGNLRGRVRRFGYESHEGISVRMKGVHVALETDPDGSWEVEELPVGRYGAEISFPGYEQVDLKDLLVLPGVHELDPVELRIGKRLIEGTKWEILPSPSGKGALAFEPEGRLLWIDPDRSDPFWIGVSTRSPSFTEDGSRVVYLDEVASGSRALNVFDVESRSRTRIAARVLDWQVGPGGDSIAFVRELGPGERILEFWNHLAGERAQIALSPIDWQLGPGGKIVLARVPVDDGGTGTEADTTDEEGDGDGAPSLLIVWDVASETVHTILDTASSDFPTVGPDGRSFVYEDTGGKSLLWNGWRRMPLPLEPTPAFWSFDGEGDRFLVVHRDGSLDRWNLLTNDRIPVATGVAAATFAPDGKRIAFVRWLGDGRQQLRIWDPDDGGSSRVAEALAITGFRFSPGGSALFAVLRDGGSSRLVAFSPEDGLEEIASSATLPIFSPDGTAFLFSDGETLSYREVAAGSEAVEVLRGVVPHGASPSAGWWKGYVWVTTDAHHVGHLRILDRRSREVVWEAERVHPPSVQATDGGLFYLDDCNTRSDRGRLMRWDEGSAHEIQTGVRLADEGSGLSPALPASFTPRGGKGLFQSDRWPERAPRILALYDATHDEATPIDSMVIDAAVGESWLLWVAADESRDPKARTGLFLAKLPLPTWPQETP